MRQPSGTNRDLYGVSFTDANTGTTVGGYGAILRTTEPGADADANTAAASYARADCTAASDSTTSAWAVVRS